MTAVDRAALIDAAAAHRTTVHREWLAGMPGRYWLTCRCGWVSADLPSMACMATWRAEITHYLDAILPLIMQAIDALIAERSVVWGRYNTDYTAALEFRAEADALDTVADLVRSLTGDSDE